MSGTRRFEHACLRSPRLDAALDYYSEVVGLRELHREDGVVYLGAGGDENFDLALVEGSAGVEHFALRADDAAELDRFEELARQGGLDPERRPGRGPGELECVSFTLCSGHRMEFVTVADHAYLEPYRPARVQPGGMAVLDADHINLVSPDVRGLAEQLRDVFGFRVSDAIQLPDDPQKWLAAWLRVGEFHHDVAILHDDDADHTLHHYAWSCASIDHIKSCCDRLAAHGIRLEIGIGRHPAGANLFAYYWDPSGNRTELSAEMALVGAGAQPRIWGSTTDTFDAWSTPIVPDSFRHGS